HHPAQCGDFSEAGRPRRIAGRGWFRCVGQGQRLPAQPDLLRHPHAASRWLPDVRDHQAQRQVRFGARGDVVIQGRCIRQGARAHGRLAGVPDQTIYQGPVAADRAAVRRRQRRSDVMAIQKILVVDDSKTELMFMTDLLQKNGFSVKTAENAEDAFRRLAEEKPDLILMDVVMPGQNGFQLTRAITRDPLYADVPIIMCTSKNQETDRVWGMRQGARDYITKPIDSDELVAKIKALG